MFAYTNFSIWQYKYLIVQDATNTMVETFFPWRCVKIRRCKYFVTHKNIDVSFFFYAFCKYTTFLYFSLVIYNFFETCAKIAYLSITNKLKKTESDNKKT